MNSKNVNNPPVYVLIQSKWQIISISAIFLFFILIVFSYRVQAIGTTSAVGWEAENGTLAGAVQIENDPSASNGKYVQFTAIATPSATPSPTPVTGLIVSNLFIADTQNASHFSFHTNILTGNILYGDRTYTIKALPTPLTGSQWIQSANNSKTWNAGKTLLSFTISRQAVVSLAVDTRLKKLAWMDASWIDSGMKLLDTEHATITFAIFQKTFPTGTVSLGPNAGPTASDMYTVIVQ